MQVLLSSEPSNILYCCPSCLIQIDGLHIGGYCYLHAPEPNEQKHNFLVSSFAACTLQILYGAGYGNDSLALSNTMVPDEGACCTACYSNPNCLYWDFVRSTRTCRLKGDQGRAIPLGYFTDPGFYYDETRVAGGKRGGYACVRACIGACAVEPVILVFMVCTATWLMSIKTLMNESAHTAHAWKHCIEVLVLLLKMKGYLFLHLRITNRIVI